MKSLENCYYVIYHQTNKKGNIVPVGISGKVRFCEDEGEWFFDAQKKMQYSEDAIATIYKALKSLNRVSSFDR